MVLIREEPFSPPRFLRVTEFLARYGPHNPPHQALDETGELWADGGAFLGQRRSLGDFGRMEFHHAFVQNTRVTA